MNQLHCMYIAKKHYYCVRVSFVLKWESISMRHWDSLGIQNSAQYTYFWNWIISWKQLVDVYQFIRYRKWLLRFHLRLTYDQYILKYTSPATRSLCFGFSSRIRRQYIYIQGDLTLCRAHELSCLSSWRWHRIKYLITVSSFCSTQ